MMDIGVGDSSQRKDKDDAGCVRSAKDLEAEDDVDDGDCDVTKSLLPAIENRILRSFDKGTRKVQWNDSIGNDLAEVLEFAPSEASENEDEDSNSCLCTVM